MRKENIKKRNSAIIKSIFFIIIVVYGYSFYVFNTHLEYSDKVISYITLVAGGIGGVGTLIAVLLTNNETRRIQEEIKLKSNLEKDIDEVDRYIEECKQLVYSIEALFTRLGFLSAVITDYYKGKISDTELNNNFLLCQKEITDIRLRLFHLKLEEVEFIVSGINLIYSYLTKLILFIEDEGINSFIYLETCMQIAKELNSYASDEIIELINQANILRSQLYEQKSLL